MAVEKTSTGWVGAVAYTAALSKLRPLAEQAVAARSVKLWGTVLKTAYRLVRGIVEAHGGVAVDTQLPAWDAPLPPRPDVAAARLYECVDAWEKEQAAGEPVEPDADWLAPAAESEDELEALLSGLDAEFNEPAQGPAEDPVEAPQEPAQGPKLLGWMKVPQGESTCSTCLIQASRGGMFLAGKSWELFSSRENAGNAGHSSCDCARVPVFRGVKVDPEVRARVGAAYTTYKAAKDAVSGEDVAAAQERLQDVTARHIGAALRQLESSVAYQRLPESERKWMREATIKHAARKADSSAKRAARANLNALRAKIEESQDTSGG